MKFRPIAVTAAIIAVALIGIAVGGRYDPFKVHLGTTVLFGNNIGLIGNAYPPCTSTTGVQRAPRATPQATYVYYGPNGLVVGCDGDPVGPFHFNGIVHTGSTKAASPPSCLSTGTCQIDGEIATGTAASPAPTCPPGSECFAFASTGSGMRDLTVGDGGGTLPASGIVLVSDSASGGVLGNTQMGSYAKGPAGTTWQSPFGTCPLRGSCTLDLHVATQIAPQTVTTSMVPPCSGSLECLGYNGTTMRSVNYGYTIGAAMTLQMSP